MTSLEIVLASNSPRRRELLTWMDLPFTATAADIDETPLAGELPADYVLRLAEEKARACQRQAGFGAVILAADTTVADGDEIIGKPRDRADALRILRQLRGRTHLVHTAIVVGVPSRGLTTEELCSTEVRMRRYSEEDLLAYVESDDPLDKAGAYAIQNPQFDPVQKISGCYASVMGLPLCHLERSLRRLGFGARKGIPYRCMRELAYTCPIFKRVLAGEDVG
ncbi:MAG TPA: Maf family protein [Anaerolineaceae bacterium]|nr:septum formation protein Maf [Anaerolineaceae bacterium]HOV06791.1 Maf family protein [Anaerolineaceae bacterium]